MRASDLPLFVARPFSPDGYVIGDANREAWQAVQSWPGWPDGAMAIMGPAGSGKTYLARLWARRAGADWLDAGAPGAGLKPDILSAWSQSADRHRVIENCDQSDIVVLFDFLNLVRKKQGTILLTMTRHPDDWAQASPDLLSRLRAMPKFPILLPGEEMLVDLLKAFSAQAGLLMATQVASYAAPRIGRTFQAARQCVQACQDAVPRGETRIGLSTMRQALQNLDCGDTPLEGHSPK